MLPVDRLNLGRSIENILVKAQVKNDRKGLEELRDVLRESASRVEGILSGLPQEKKQY